MAIDYNVDLATPSSVPKVASELHGVARAIGLFDSSATIEDLRRDGVTSRLGTWIRVGEARPQPWDPVITDLGFNPTVWVFFRLDKFTDVGHQQDDMVRLVSSLLDRVHGDAVLYGDHEQIWLLRRGGVLSLSEDVDLWPRHRLATVPQPYHRATFAFSED